MPPFSFLGFAGVRRGWCWRLFGIYLSLTYFFLVELILGFSPRKHPKRPPTANTSTASGLQCRTELNPKKTHGRFGHRAKIRHGPSWLLPTPLLTALESSSFFFPSKTRMARTSEIARDQRAPHHPPYKSFFHRTRSADTPGFALFFDQVGP